ncbi:MAG: serine/threonine-protein kinase [Myxococcota bacterium]
MKSSSPDSASPFKPEAYGRYYLVDKIAIGGMAEVFKARRFSDGGFQMLLVIKRILQQFSENDEFIQMFVDEAKISVQLQHPNIVQIYDFGKLRDNYFIAMECVEGKDLKSILRTLAHRRKLMPQEFAVYIAHEVCKGLDYAHKKADMNGRPLGIVHRDISPSNILLSYDGDAKIADFGIAKAQTSAYNTKDGVLKGKFEYMSPEQASGQIVDFKSDLFSAGILLHEMLTGRRLFKTDSDLRTLEKIKSVAIQAPSARNPRVPPALDAIVMRALSRDPAERFRDAKEMQTALAEHLYPATPSMTGDSLGEFMKELFRDEISAERQRLQQGTRLATDLHEHLLSIQPENTEEWTGSFTSQTLQSSPPPRRMSALLLVALVVLLPLAGIGAYVMFDQQPPPTEEPTPITSGILHVEVRPSGTAARYLLDGNVLGEGATLTQELNADQKHTLRVEATGYIPHEESIVVAAGERLRLSVRLQPVPLPPEPVVIATPEPVASPDPKPEPVAAPPRAAPPSPPRMRFSSTPAGATIKLDGEVIGQTPLTWSDSRPNTEHKVEYALDGYEIESFSVQMPGTGRRDSTGRTLTPKVAKPGTLNVQVRRGWAHVYVDDVKVGETPFITELTPGAHTIRVENPEIEFINQKSVQIISGETTRVTL